MVNFNLYRKLRIYEKNNKKKLISINNLILVNIDSQVKISKIEISETSCKL